MHCLCNFVIVFLIVQCANCQCFHNDLINSIRFEAGTDLNWLNNCFNIIHNILHGNGKHMCVILESEIDVAQ